MTTGGGSPIGTASATTTTLHAIEHEQVSFDLDPDDEPPRVLVIGPDSAGNLLEVTVIGLADDRMIAIHAMKLRGHFCELLPREEGSS